jgi:hypothetical protein
MSTSKSPSWFQQGTSLHLNPSERTAGLMQKEDNGNSSKPPNDYDENRKVCQFMPLAESFAMKKGATL